MQGISFLLIGNGGFGYLGSMFDEEPDARKKPGTLKNLERMSLDELAVYIEELKAEIVRVEEDVVRKKAKMQAASSFFKS